MRRAIGVLVVVSAVSLDGVVVGTAADPPKVEDLAWMAGGWGGRDGPSEVEEHWTRPRAGTMLGVNRTVRGDRTVSFEFLRIEAGAAGLVYLASPQGRPATPFPLKELSGQRVVFENPEHDFPRRILYWLDAQRVLHARIEGSRGGKTVGQEWAWPRLEPAGPPGR